MKPTTSCSDVHGQTNLSNSACGTQGTAMWVIDGQIILILSSNLSSMDWSIFSLVRAIPEHVLAVVIEITTRHSVSNVTTAEESGTRRRFAAAHHRGRQVQTPLDEVNSIQVGVFKPNPTSQAPVGFWNRNIIRTLSGIRKQMGNISLKWKKNQTIRFTQSEAGQSHQIHHWQSEWKKTHSLTQEATRSTASESGSFS